MKIQDLPQPYRALAEMRREQQINSEWVKKCDTEFTETNELHLAFYWENTPEGGDWWKDLNEGNTPEIPAESLAELKEWQKEHPEFEATVIAGQPKETETQFGISATCDFVENTWTFEMPEGFKVSAGEFAIIPKSEYDLINEGKKRNLL